MYISGINKRSVHVVSHADCVRHCVYLLEINSPLRFTRAAQMLSMLSILGIKLIGTV